MSVTSNQSAGTQDCTQNKYSRPMKVATSDSCLTQLHRRAVDEISLRHFSALHPLHRTTIGRHSMVESQSVPAMSAQGIRKSFVDKEILKGIDLDIQPGEHVAVIGPSGSGKSTFIRCLNLLERPDTGTIDVLGKRVLDLATKPSNRAIRELRKQVGMAFQSFNLFATKSAL